MPHPAIRPADGRSLSNRSCRKSSSTSAVPSRSTAVPRYCARLASGKRLSRRPPAMPARIGTQLSVRHSSCRSQRPQQCAPRRRSVPARRSTAASLQRPVLRTGQHDKALRERLPGGAVFQRAAGFESDGDFTTGERDTQGVRIECAAGNHIEVTELLSGRRQFRLRSGSVPAHCAHRVRRGRAGRRRAAHRWPAFRHPARAGSPALRPCR